MKVWDIWDSKAHQFIGTDRRHTTKKGALKELEKIRAYRKSIGRDSSHYSIKSKIVKLW